MATVNKIHVREQHAMSVAKSSVKKKAKFSALSDWLVWRLLLLLFLQLRRFKNKEEQIIETQDIPQCLVAAKATLTLTVPGYH